MEFAVYLPEFSRENHQSPKLAQQDPTKVIEIIDNITSNRDRKKLDTYLALLPENKRRIFELNFYCANKLFLAAVYGDYKVFMHFLTSRYSYVGSSQYIRRAMHTLDPNNNTIIMAAALGGNEQILKHVLKNAENLLLVCNQFGKTVLDFADGLSSVLYPKLQSKLKSFTQNLPAAKKLAP